MHGKPGKNQIPYLLIAVLVAGVSALLIVPFFIDTTRNDTDDQQAQSLPTLSVPTLEARAAFVYDVRNNHVLFQKNADEQLPLASITKILTVLTAQKVFSPDTIITITENALAEEGDSGLLVNEAWVLDELLKFILITSSNDGSAALQITHDSANTERFTTIMDRQAQELGLSSFSIRNVTGLDTPDTVRATNYGSARDVATLFLYALHTIPNILDATRAGTATMHSLTHTHRIENTNEIIDAVSNAVGGKTGFTDAAGGNLVMSFDRDIGNPVILVVLGSSKEGRFTDMQRLVNAVRTAQF